MATADALEAFDHFLSIHPFCEAGNALGIAGAAANKFHIMDFLFIV